MGWETDLSEREQEILKLVATGAGNKEIARRLGISPNTVKVHLQNIFEKTGVSSRTEAAMLSVNQPTVEGTAGVVFPPGKQAGVSKGGKKSQVLVLLLGLFLVGGLAFWAGGLLTKPHVESSPAESAQRWQKGVPLPGGRSAAAAATYEGSLYLIGGETSEGVDGVVLRYRESPNQWAEMAMKPTPVSAAGAALLGEKIYIPGGRMENGKSTGILEVFDPRQNRWEERSPLPQPTSGYAIAVLEGKAYLFGGTDGSRYYQDVFEYDPAADAWKMLSRIPKPLAYAAAVTVENKIILIGGWDGKTALSAVYAFYPRRVGGQDQAWVSLAPLPAGRYAFGAATLANMVFVFGGHDQAEPLQYSVQSNLWQPVKGNPEPVGESPAVLPLIDRLHILGGRSEGGFKPENLTYQAVYTLLIPLVEN